MRLVDHQKELNNLLFRFSKRKLLTELKSISNKIYNLIEKDLFYHVKLKPNYFLPEFQIIGNTDQWRIYGNSYPFKYRIDNFMIRIHPRVFSYDINKGEIIYSTDIKIDKLPHKYKFRNVEHGYYIIPTFNKFEYIVSADKEVNGIRIVKKTLNICLCRVKREYSSSEIINIISFHIDLLNKKNNIILNKKSVIVDYEELDPDRKILLLYLIYPYFEKIYELLNKLIALKKSS